VQISRFSSGKSFIGKRKKFKGLNPFLDLQLSPLQVLICSINKVLHI